MPTQHIGLVSKKDIKIHLVKIDTMSSSHPKAQECKTSKVHNYLMRHTVPKGNAFTHTSLGRPLGCFYVPAEAQQSFFKMYAESIDNGDDIALTEKHRHLSPVLIDLDFRFPLKAEDPLTHKYTPEHLQTITRIYAEEMMRIFQPTDTSFILYVMEKPGASIYQKRIKDGIHIVVPSLVSKPPAQYVLRNRVIPQLADLFASMGVTNKVEDIVDEAVIERNNWMMYGSKKPNSDAYKLTHMYEYNIETGEMADVIDEYEFTTFDLVSELSIRNKHDETPMTNEAMPEIGEIENVLNERRKKMDTSKTIVGEEQNAAENEYYALEEIQALISVLSVDRANNYNDWIRLGWCLRNIDHRLMNDWIEFSKKSPKFQEGECERLWTYMKKCGLGAGTLHMWAKKDNPVQYAEIIRRDLRKLLFESRSGTHNDVARVVYHMYQYDFVCASIRHRTWYEFRNHHWHLSDSAFTLRIKLSNEVWREYMAAARDLSHRATEATDQDQQEKLHEYAKKMLETAQKLKTTNFKDNVMKECAEMFYIEKFEEKLDSQIGLIGFENGVYDLDAEEFREGRPEDYVSFSTNINYIPFDPSHPVIIEIKAYLAQVLTRPAVREYVLKLFSTFLHGAVKEQKFNIWTGVGSNSKSLCVNLFENSFGDYCCKFPITLLTQKRAASNAATAELARAKGKRFACLQEPSEDEKLNIGLMKELSGGDKIMARALFSNPIEFAPQFKMLLLCNHLPAVPSDDGGTWRRIRVVEFTSRFVDNPHDENEFPIDYDLPNKMLKWKEHFMAMLLEYHKLYKVEGNPEPEEVLACTREYKRQNDHLADFMHSCVEDKMGAFLSINEAFAELKAWAKEDNIPIKIPTKAELEKYMAKQCGKCTIGNNVKGFKNTRLKNRHMLTSTGDPDGASTSGASGEVDELGDCIDA